jgi:hypothetical protein
MLLPFAVVAAITATGLVPADHFHWQGRIPAGQSIEINGVYGSIRAEPASGDRAEVTAFSSGRQLDASELQVEMLQRPDGIMFRAHSPELPADGVRIDFTVRVPKGVRFIGRTVNGSVEALSLRSDASAYTVNGDVSLRTAGEAHAETVNGSIRASLGRSWSRRDQQFSTVNGGITLEMPSRVNATIHAQTLHGRIHTDFDVPVQSRMAGRSARGALGKGGPEVKVNTVNGDIHLRRAVVTL